MSSPTVSIEALIMTCIINAREGREVIMCDIPGTFMQVDMDEQVFLKLEGDIATLLVRLDETYREFLSYKNGKPVIYAELSKALYGMLQAALLF